MLLGPGGKCRSRLPCGRRVNQAAGQSCYRFSRRRSHRQCCWGRGVNAEIASRTIEELSKLLGSPATAYHAAEAISKVARAGGGVEVASRAVEELSKLLGSPATASRAAEVIGSVVGAGGVNAEIACRTIEELSKLVGSPDTVSNAAYAIGKVVDTLPIKLIVGEFNKSYVNQRGKEIFTKKLLTKLTELSNSTDTTKIVPTVKDMLSVINIMSDIDETEKQCKELAQIIINKQIILIDGQVKDSIILEINQNFVEISNKPSALVAIKRMMTAVYHKALSDGEISEADSEFIINCIKMGLTTKITRDGKIIFNGVTYILLQTAENKKYLEEITEVALHQRNDLLARQYTEHVPLFTNSGTVLVQSAADLKDVSVVNGREIAHNKWQIALMHLSNHLKQEPSKIFILLERRDEYGYHVINKIQMVASGLNVEVYIKHPNEIQNTDFLKEIFGPMEYISTKPRYYGSIFETSLEAGKVLIEKVKSIGNISSSIPDTEYDILHTLISNYRLEQNINITDNLGAWNEYVSQDTIQTFAKAQLLKVDSTIVRQASVVITLQDEQQLHASQLKDHDTQLSKHEQRLKMHGKAITDMKGVINLLESVTEKLQEDVVEAASS